MAISFAIRMCFSVSAAGNRHFHLTPPSCISASGGWRVIPRPRISPAKENSGHNAWRWIIFCLQQSEYSKTPEVEYCNLRIRIGISLLASSVKSQESRGGTISA
jgi:hypothetical protein